MKIEPDSWCLCGSGKRFRGCCYESSGDGLVFLEAAFEKAIKYRDSQGGKIEGIPIGLFGQFAKSSLSRFRCLVPGCGEQTISCHSMPVNILREQFGNHCSEFRLQDAPASGQFTKTGIDKAGTLPVFCSKHDNSLFRNIDTLNIDWLDHKQLFLLTVKAIAFSLRRTQCLLGIDSQTELIRPVLISESNQNANGNVQINISHLHEQYIRFCILYDLFLESIAAHEKMNWGYFSYLSRHIDYNQNILFSGLVNPSHDLEGSRINKADTPISMVCNIFTKDDRLHVLFSCPDGASRSLYQNLLTQISESEEQTFVSILNNIMTFASEKPMMPEEFMVGEAQSQHISLLQQKAGRALNSFDSEVLDLKNTDQAVQFISMVH